MNLLPDLTTISCAACGGDGYAILSSGSAGDGLPAEQRAPCPVCGGAGDLAHLHVQAEGPECWCGRHGCLNSVVRVQELLVRAAAGDRDALSELYAAHRPLAELLARRTCRPWRSCRRAGWKDSCRRSSPGCSTTRNSARVITPDSM